jgi:hypothetical protein
MSFLRHARSIGPMWVLTSRKAQLGCRLPLVGTVNRHKGATEIAPLLIVRDESHRLSLGGLLSSRARLRFAGCVQFAMKEYGRSRNFQRTANSVLTVCVSSGDKRNWSFGRDGTGVGLYADGSRNASGCSDSRRRSRVKPSSPVVSGNLLTPKRMVGGRGLEPRTSCL